MADTPPVPTRAENDAADSEFRSWLAGAPDEPTLEPGLEIVDPHHHLWIDALHGGPSHIGRGVIRAPLGIF